MKSYLFTAFALCTAGSVAMAANPVLVDSGGSGQFTSVQAAISSWCAGGTNAGETAPFVINIKAGSGPYDEVVTLEAANVGKGDIVGNIEIKSDTPGTKVVLKLQPATALVGGVGGTDDGLFISQNDFSATFRDIVFTRSLTVLPIDEIVRIDEPSANNNVNTMAFYNCVFTEADTAGNPMVTDKVGALVPPPARGGTGFSTSARPFQAWGDAGESINVTLDNCVVYGANNINCIIRLEGTLGTGDGNGNPEVCTINNTMSAYAFNDCFNLGGINQNATFNITGTDQTAGPLNCTAALWPAHKGGTANNGHAFTLSSSGNSLIDNTTKLNFNGVLGYAPADGSTNDGFSSTATRGISGGSSAQTLANVALYVPNYGVVDTTRVATTWDKVTIVNTTNAYWGGGANNGSVAITNSILAGAGTKIGGTFPIGGIALSNSAVPLSGPQAATAVGTGVVETAVINDDPMFVSLDGTSADFLDVSNVTYATAGTGSTPLAGGADYAVGASVNEWSLY